MPFPTENITYEGGYFNADSELVKVPDGSFISPSSNALFTKYGKLVSFKGLYTSISEGGTRAFTLDRDLVGLMGLDDGTNAGEGNIIQGVGRSLWFVGNTNADTGMVRVYDFNGATSTDIGALSSTPQVAYRNDLGTGWDTPVQVGLAEQTTAPILALVDDNNRSAGFDGIIQGSISCRIARKRKGVVSIASPPSNVVTADNDSVTVAIPAIVVDGSDEWYLYFTVAGRGSQYSHLLFPLTLAETEIEAGGTTPTLRSSGNAKLKVISQHDTTQLSRLVEVEYYANDLLALAPFEDYFPADSAKFIAQLGNVLLLFGTGDDGTGFDVSYPNNHEAFPVDWRDWFPEQPVAICPAPESGFIWVCTANTIFQAGWAGTTEQTAPVILRQVSDKYGCIGEQAVCSVNGTLFCVSQGNTPIMVSPDGNIDINVGARVSAEFTSYDDTAIVRYDEESNSVVFIKGSTGIALNLTTQNWSAPLTMDNPIESGFSINGKLYLCVYSLTGWKSYRFNYGTDSTWNLTSNFRAPVGMELFDLVEVRALLESSNTSGTVTVASLKNWSTSSPRTLTTYTFTAAGVKAKVWAFVEVLDLESYAIKVSGTKGGEVVHLVLVKYQPHTINRGT